MLRKKKEGTFSFIAILISRTSWEMGFDYKTQGNLYTRTHTYFPHTTPFVRFNIPLF